MNTAGKRAVGIEERDVRELNEWQPDEIALVRDIADHTWAAVERARIRAALRASEERFRQVAEHSPNSSGSRARTARSNT